MRARLWGVSSLTLPPPMSVRGHEDMFCPMMAEHVYVPQWHPANQTSTTSVVPFESGSPSLNCRSNRRWLFPPGRPMREGVAHVVSDFGMSPG